MTSTQPKPDKQQVRDYLAQRSKSKAPPPSQNEIRRALGWGLVNFVAVKTHAERQA